MQRKTLKKILPASARDWMARRRQQSEFNALKRKAPELLWEACAPCPERIAEGGNVKIGHEVFIVGGYQSIDRVLSVISVFNLRKQKWTRRIAMPPEMPQTHFGIAGDGERFLYAVGGQLGPRCSPAVADSFVLDVQTGTWGRLPPLPEARYGPVLQVWRGRLHALSGARPDRSTSALDHWSLAIASEKSSDARWQNEAPISKGGPHRSSAVLNDRLYLFAGQDGDIRPVPGDPTHRCDYNTPLEVPYADSFMLEDRGGEWRAISPMPVARTHAEVAVTIGPSAVIVGGNEERLRVSDLIQVYDTRLDRWTMAGRLPFFMKTAAAFHEGRLYAFAGQRSKSLDDLRPGKVTDSVWRAKFDPERDFAG